jgi:predicted ATP-dependent protease
MARLEDTGDYAEGAARVKSIEPAPLPLSLKVVLVGNEYIYDSLLETDDRFPKLFKIKAHMTETSERTAAGIRNWLSGLSSIVHDNKLLHFDRDALAGLVDFSSRLCEDQRKLSLHMPQIRDVMVEASALAGMRGADAVSREHLVQALNSRYYRANLVEELYLEDYDRNMIKVATDGVAIGRINGLSVTWFGDFEFGLPHQISCTVGVGHGGIIDLEREAELGGPIHTKAMLILKSYLVDQFAKNKPLVLTGSLCFEQNYAEVEGDSASGAELAALLSAIAGVPLRLSLAFTGAVGQSGQIMAVGGVTRKIEGFFQVCSRRGLTGKQGVIIPHDNIDHLMLARPVITAVQNGEFFITPVRHITEALELLTGMPSGKPLKKGGFTRGSLYDLVDRRLNEFGNMAEHAYSRPHRKRGRS